ncbi:unnamed protein product [Brassica rapa]|uniref:F-box domain-containing protein n=1 Tax=Brassica campestris TaxID=3711 RepID=A0A3P5ZIU9_BRACM|nr:unnamed protein product [Brassica rapa]VDC78099.1 unnamed protein product [Brassica rapa]
MERQERFENMPKWEKMDKDMLANIFKKLDMVDVIMGASRVCITWFLASHNKTIWNTIKLNDFDSIVLDNSSNPHLQDNNNARKHLYNLKEILIEINKFSRAAPVDFFFNVNTNVLVEDLEIISNGKWKNLQTLIITKITKDGDLNHELKAIAENCKNLTTIKVAYALDQELANIIVGKLPNLKSLSFRSTSVSVEAVKSLIIGLHNLKSLNLSHCVFTKRCNNDVWNHPLNPQYHSNIGYKQWETDEMKEFEF